MILRYLREFANVEKANSFTTVQRLKRFALFRSLIQSLPRPLRILDVGGTQVFWQTMQFHTEPGVHITILNQTPVKVTHQSFDSDTGDACDLSRFKDKSFDIVFSNSVIEHVGSFEDQKRMADEVRRVGRHYFIQTPNRYFPIEPHFVFPFFQFLPLTVRIGLVRRWPLGWHPRFTDDDEAREAVSSIRLLTLKEVKTLFPGARIYKERFCGLTKSFMTAGGWV